MKMFHVFFESPTVLTAIETTGAQSGREIAALLPPRTNTLAVEAESKVEAIGKALADGFSYAPLK